MIVSLSIFGISLAALCVWLTVRIIARRERWAKWTLAVVLALPILYSASFGPSCWLASRANCGVGAVETVYQPLTTLMFRSSAVAMLMVPYTELFAAPDWHWIFIEETRLDSDLPRAMWMQFDLRTGMPLIPDDEAPVAGPWTTFLVYGGTCLEVSRWLANEIARSQLILPVRIRR